MRWLIALPLLLALAGCSSGPAAPQGQEGPIAGPGDVPDASGGGEVFDLEDRGTMLHGIDGSWTFEIGADATRIDIRMSAVGIEGHAGLSRLEARALQNGTVHTDGSVAWFRGSFGGRAIDLVDISERAGDGGLAAFIGDWELVLRGHSQVADYEIDVRVVHGEAPRR